MSFLLTNKEIKTFINKTNWGEGDWNNEPDRIHWVDKDTNYPCLILRIPHHGALCGYVAVLEGHPCFGLDCDTTPVYELSVHGGVTYTDFCNEEDKLLGVCHIPPNGQSDRVWWIGFDTVHLYDYAPVFEMQKRNYTGYVFSDKQTKDVYRNLDYVIAEVESLAKQLKAIEVI